MPGAGKDSGKISSGKSQQLVLGFTLLYAYIPITEVNNCEHGRINNIFSRTWSVVQDWMFVIKPLINGWIVAFAVTLTPPTEYRGPDRVLQYKSCCMNIPSGILNINLPGGYY